MWQDLLLCKEFPHADTIQRWWHDEVATQSKLRLLWVARIPPS